MTEKRWKIHEIKDRGWGLYDLIDTEKNRKYQFDVTDGGVRELVVTLLNELHEENQSLKKDLARCKDWINSDKNDYELTLAFIKSKGYSLRDVLEYEKMMKK